MCNKLRDIHVPMYCIILYIILGLYYGILINNWMIIRNRCCIVNWRNSRLHNAMLADDSVHEMRKYMVVFTSAHQVHLLMACCKTAVTPLLTHWSYCSLEPSHRYGNIQRTLCRIINNLHVTGFKTMKCFPLWAAVVIIRKLVFNTESNIGILALVHWPLRDVWSNFTKFILKLIWQIDILSISSEISLIQVSQNPIYHKLTLVQVMAWCHQITELIWKRFQYEIQHKIIFMNIVEINKIILNIWHNRTAICHFIFRRGGNP